MDSTGRPRPIRQSSRAGAGSRQRESSYGTRILATAVPPQAQLSAGSDLVPHLQPQMSLRAPSPNPSQSRSRSASPIPPDNASTLPYLAHAGPTTNALLKGRQTPLPPALPSPPNGLAERTMSGTGPSHPLRQRPTPPRPPHQPLPPLPALPPQHQQLTKMQRQPVQGQVSTSDGTPIRRSGTGSTVASNGSGNSKFNSPPPPPAPPPRDVPLPPLPILPGMNSVSSSKASQLTAGPSSNSLRNDARDTASLGRTRAPVPDESQQIRQASLPSRTGGTRSNTMLEERSRSNSGNAAADDRVRKDSVDSAREHPTEGRPRKSSMDILRTMNARPPAARMRSPEPVAKVELAPEADMGRQSTVESYGRARGSMEMDRQMQAESSRQAQLRGLGVGPIENQAGPSRAPSPPPSQQRSASTARKSGEQDRNLLPGQSPQLNGSWPTATGKKWSMSPLVQMMDDSFSKRQDHSSHNGRRSEDPGTLMGRNMEAQTKPAVQPRKSSGGLRGLFSRGKKDKDKDKDKDTKKTAMPVPAPPVDFAPSTGPRRRASEDMLRTRRQHDERSVPVRQTATPEPGLFTRRVTEPLAPRQPPDSVGPSKPTVSPPASGSPGHHSSIKSPVSSGTLESVDSVSTVREISSLPPVLSLPLPQLPTLDFSLGSTFDSMFHSLDGKVSPAEPIANPMQSRRRSRSFSEFSKPILSPPLAATSSNLPSVDSNASLVADLMAYSKLDTVKASNASDPALPSLSSEHGRTASSASSQMMDNSPPRTPGSTETAQVNIAGSGSSCSIDGMHASTSVESADMAIVGKAWTNSTIADKNQKSVRPRLLQLAEDNSSSATIVEQDESGSEAGAKSVLSPPVTATLEPSLEVVKPVVLAIPTPAVPLVVSKIRKIPLRRKSRRVTSELDNMSLADNLRRILNMFRLSASMRNIDKAGLLRNELLESLVEGEKRGYKAGDRAGNAAVRTVCVEWVNTLLEELNKDQAANERGACLEALSAIMESSTMSIKALRGHQGDETIFRVLMIKIMSYVLGKLSSKGIFHNTLLFSGRMLAFAFFRIEGIAYQLLGALPMRPAVLSRFVQAAKSFSYEVGVDKDIVYPEHLQALQLGNARDYVDRLNSHAPAYFEQEEEEAFYFDKSGNWLRRWQSDDSELFPSFYKAYHRNLAVYLADAVEMAEGNEMAIPTSVLMQAPGYAHLAAVYATKTHSYIVGAVNAVTTTSASSSFNADESAGVRGNAKPPVLETANRRLTEIILNMANSRIFIQSSGGHVLECDGAELWSSMIDVWMKYLVSRTSLYSPRGVFCLFDLLDGVVAPSFDHLASPTHDGTPTLKASLVDIPHLISVLKLVLTETDHHLTLAKCVAFIWTHYDTLCSRVEDREALCMHLLLEPKIFERLVLFWSQSVRSYILRLIVFRLGHVATSPTDLENHEMEVATVQMVHSRLERIRRRHDELEPRDPMLTPPRQTMQLEQVDDDGEELPRSKSTIAMVEPADRPEEGATMTRAERLLGLGGTESSSMSTEVAEPEYIASKGKGKAASWFKKPFGKQKKRKPSTESESESERHIRELVPSFKPPVGRPSHLQTGMDAHEAQPVSPAALSTRSTGAESNDSFEGDVSALQPRGPMGPVISTTPALRFSTPEPPASPRSPSKVQFEFELPSASPRSDAFDKRPGNNLLSSPAAAQSRAQSSNPQRMPPSPSMSRSFSKRSSLLHPVAVGVLEGPASPSFRRSLARVPEPPGYEKRLHPYAIRMLAELEDVQQEYEEWWAEDGPGRQDSAPPRLTIAWPFSEEEE